MNFALFVDAATLYYVGKATQIQSDFETPYSYLFSTNTGYIM